MHGSAELVEIMKGAVSYGQMTSHKSVNTSLIAMVSSETPIGILKSSHLNPRNLMS